MDKTLFINKKKKLINAKLKANLISWLIILPSVLLFMFYIWAPQISNIILSFANTTGFRVSDQNPFAGFNNYIAVFKNTLFQRALLNTLSYTLWSLLIGFLIPLVLAVLISEAVHFRGFFKSSYYIPNIVPGIAAVIMWQVMMDADVYGFFNVVLQKLGLEPFGWISEKNASIPIIVLTMTWKGAGATMLIYLASIQTINPEMYEVARLEGAGFLKRIRHIMLPSLFGNIKLLLIMQVISVFQVFYEPYVFAKGGTDSNTISLTQLIHKLGFTSDSLPNFAGQSAALGVIVSGILLVFSVIYFSVGKERVAHEKL